MAGFEDRDRPLVAKADFDLGHKIGKWIDGPPWRAGAKQGLHPVCLGANRIDLRDPGTIRQLVDIVANAGEGRGEDHPAISLDRKQFLAKNECDRATKIFGPAFEVGVVQCGGSVDGHDLILSGVYNAAGLTFLAGPVELHAETADGKAEGLAAQDGAGKQGRQAGA